MTIKTAALRALAWLSLGLVVGCGGADEARHSMTSGGLGTGVQVGPCEDGASQACGYKIGQASGVISCYEGVQYCEGGAWSECTDGDVVGRPDPNSREMLGFRQAQSLSMWQACVNNACDPNCRYFDENPTPDVTTMGGSTPPTTPSFPGGPAVAACAHDLCTTGAALTNGCTACTSQVCTAQPSCCTTSWTSACTDLVYTLCASQSPPKTLCDFGLYSDTTLTVANRGTANAVVGAYGNVTIDTDGAVAGVWSKGNITYNSLNGATVTAPSGIIADGQVNSQDSNSTINAYISAGGNVFIPSWDVQQYVSTGGSLTGQNSTTILGNVKANAGISNVSSVGGSSCTTAGCFTYTPLSFPPQVASTAIPTLPTICTGTTNFIASGGATTVAGPGTYGDVDITNNGSLTLTGEGTYYFKSFQISDKVILRRTATNTGAGWDIRVCNTVNFRNNTQFRGSTAGGVIPALVVEATPNAILMDPSLVRFYANTASAITMDTDVYFTGVFMAPNASVSKSNVNSPPTKAAVTGGTRSAPVNGAIWARTLTLGTDALTLQISKAACQAVLPGTVTAGACPIANLSAPVPAATVEKCGSGLDCQINESCTDPETGATCAHSKCMPGAALNSSCDTCVARVCAADATCCSTSWTQSCVDKVGTLCDAKCGTYSCYFGGLCSANAAVPDKTCNTCVNSICAVDPACCTTAWTTACADKVYTVCGSGVPTAPTNGSSICDFAAYAAGVTTIKGTSAAQRAILSGGRVGGLALTAMDLSYSTITGNVSSAGPFTTLSTTISGTLTYGSGANSLGAGTTYSSLIGPANPPQPARPTRVPTCPGGATPTTGTIAPGNYGAVAIPNGNTLTLQAGTYNFTSLTIGTSTGTAGSNGKLALPAVGDVIINVCGAANFYNYSSVTNITAATATRLDFYATGLIKVWNNATVYGVFNSNTNVAVNAAGRLFGLAWSGGTINVLGNAATVDATGLNAACKTKFDPNFASTTRRIDRLCGYGAYAKKGAATTGLTLTGGDIGAGTTFINADTSRIYTNVFAQGAVTKGTTSTYYQSIRSRSTISGTATVLGTASASASASAVPVPSWPTVSFACAAGKPPTGVDQNLWGATLAPATYGHVTMAGAGQNLTLQAGDYYVGNFTMTQANTTLTLPGAGNVRIFACGTVNFGAGMTLVNGGTGATVGKFRVYSLSTAAVDAAPAIYVNSGAGKSIGGLLVAPAGKISIGASSTLNGAAWADSFFAANASVVNARSFSGATCEGLTIDASPVCPETMSGTPPAEVGDCLANGIGYKDTTCSTFDLALGIPCANTVPVCNHGTTDFSGTVNLSYWKSSRGQMSLLTPTATADGTCSIPAVSIVAGNCTDVTCAIPTGETHTVMVNPASTVNECGAGTLNRRMDNWTVDDDQSCGSSATVTTVEYGYEAVCPPDTIGRWGTLTWNTEAPGDSDIEFFARTAPTAAGLAGATYVSIGSATSTPADTQVCPIASGPSACYVDLTADLALGTVNQPQFMDLKMVVTPDGTDAPILKDWNITYSCAYDQ